MRRDAEGRGNVRWAGLFAAFFWAGCLAATAQTPTLADRIQAIIGQPEFKHAMFGVEFYSLDTGRVVYALNGDKLFVPASTTKLLTMGTALALLGPDYRFHTRIYRAGPLGADGTLEGDLVLVASGDPNLSGRIQPDGTLAFENIDHCYGGSPDARAVPGDPLLVIRQLAQQVAQHGVKRIAGRILIDVSLFPEGQAELGTGTVISPILVNDNIVDVTLAPGDTLDAPASLKFSPDVGYVYFINRATTGAAGTDSTINWAKDEANPDGTRTVTVAGTMPLGSPPILFTYGVPKPSLFAALSLVKALGETGITIETANAKPPDFKALAADYTPANLMAEHISPPFSEEVKVTLKVSQNLHASIMPYLLGALLKPDVADHAQAGFDLEHDFLAKAGLDLTGASQADGAGGAPSGLFTPDFMVHYLAFMAQQPNFAVFLNALPVLGHDGTLWNIQAASPAAGHIHAKTGTLVFYDALNHDLMVTGKGLAGYILTPGGHRWAFALYAHNVEVPSSDDAITKIVGQAVGAIANAGYLEAVKEDGK